MSRTIFLAWLKGELDEALLAIEIVEKEIGRRVRRVKATIESSRLSLQDSEEGDVPLDNYVGATYRMIGAIVDDTELALQIQALHNLRALVKKLPPPPDPRFWDGEVCVPAQVS